MRDIRRYKVFELADGLVLQVYRMTAGFPKSEVFGLTLQMRRAAYSAPMNLAEGAARTSSREFARFVDIAVGSSEEVRYQLHLAAKLGYVESGRQVELDRSYEEVKKMLSGLLTKLCGDRRADSRQPTADRRQQEAVGCEL